MSKPEKEMFRKYLQQSTHQFEFGSGGSTVRACKQPSIQSIVSVDSSNEWLIKVQNECKSSRLNTIFVNIGPTKEWGQPKLKSSESWEAQSKSFDQRNPATDLVLVDGRFRVACAAQVAMHSKSKVMIHDYWNRPAYHVLNTLFDKIDGVDTLGIFIPKENNYSAAFDLWNRQKRIPN